ncbi:MAG TPA: nuclear transport factor 2 family protein [Candidatus Eisenbacteria bacterium]|nr:nuclear transport factor 2 family protein [Candidatus Eisenbacteria bacterium]
MRAVATIVLVLAAVCAASCTTQQGTGGMDIAVAKQSVDSLWTGYAVAMDRHDAAAMGSLFTEDARLDLDKSPTRTGRAAVQASLDSLYRDFDATGFRVRPDDFKISGTLAVQAGEFEEDGSRPGKPPERTYGRYVMVLEMGEKGAWKIARLTAIADSIRPLP